MILSCEESLTSSVLVGWGRGRGRRSTGRRVWMQSPAGRCLAPEAGKVEPCLPPAPSCGSCATPSAPGGPSLHAQGLCNTELLRSCVKEHACWTSAGEQWRKRQA